MRTPWWAVIAAVAVAAATTLAAPGAGVPTLWDVTTMAMPDRAAPALGLAIAGLTGALAWIAASGVGRRASPVAAALNGAIAAFWLAPAPLDPSPVPLALLGLAWLATRRKGGSVAPANDNAPTAALSRFSWVPAPAAHDTDMSIQIVR